MVEGTVKFFNRMKKFGFINGDDGKDYFVHESGIDGKKPLNEGDRVTFTAVVEERGPRAEKVRLL